METTEMMGVMPWYHGPISRDEAESMLLGTDDGHFLIRDSTNFPGNFTLCMAYEGKVEHYRIYQIEDQYSCDKEELFDNLTQLVSHYKRDADGLVHRLVTPLISEEFKKAYFASNNINGGEKRTVEFQRANLLLARPDLTLLDSIGHGEFGDVLLGEYKGRKVAVKTLRDEASNDLLKEAKFMIALHHEKLVALVGVVVADNDALYMLTEYMANGNLVDFLRSRGRHHVDRLQLAGFLRDVAEGMQYMESENLVHRDLAARNVLLDSSLQAKISDFGLAQATSSPIRESNKGKFPIKWTAPEALREGLFTNKSDVWSYGIVVWEVYSFGRIPYPRIPIQDVVRHIEKGYRMEPPEGSPAFIIKIMRDCWVLEPSKRPTFTLIVEELKCTGEFSAIT